MGMEKHWVEFYKTIGNFFADDSSNQMYMYIIKALAPKNYFFNDCVYIKTKV